MNTFKSELLIKELDLIDTTISRLDLQIEKGKHFCITIWLGLLVFFFLDNFLELNEKTLGFVLLLSVLTPLVFWLMDFYWRKALLDVSWRQKIISLFVNNKAFQYEDSEFALLDPVGFIFSVNDYPEYIKNDKNFIKKPSNLEAFLLQRRQMVFWGYNNLFNSFKSVFYSK